MKDIFSSKSKQIRQVLDNAGKVIEDLTKANFKKTGLPLSLERGISRKLWKKGYGIYIGLKKDYRLAFFEIGTVPRYTKKKRYRGIIKARYFFREAKYKKLNDAVNIIQNGIAKLFK